MGHCKINRSETGYGFAKDYYVHPNLEDLVLHYQRNSLREHNDQLDVTLERPIKVYNSSVYTVMGYNHQ